MSFGYFLLAILMFCGCFVLVALIAQAVYGKR